MKHKNFSKGYSMIELVIYISLFVVLSAVVIQSLIFTMKTYASARSYRTLQQNGELVMERITREIRESSAISTGGSSFGVSPGVFALSGEDGNGVPVTKIFDVNNGSVRLTIDGVVSNISGPEVAVSNLTFWNVTATNVSAVKVQLSLTTVNPPILNSNFYTTVNLRN